MIHVSKELPPRREAFLVNGNTIGVVLRVNRSRGLAYVRWQDKGDGEVPLEAVKAGMALLEPFRCD